jgi:flavoprotein
MAMEVVMEKKEEKEKKKRRVAWGITGSGDRLIETVEVMKEIRRQYRNEGKFEFLLIAPATSNTVAKISNGIGDSLLCNAAIMGLKAFVPFYIMPSDYEEGMIVTKLPDGRDMKLRIRKEDVEHAKKLASMDDVYVLEKPEEIHQVFKKHFKPEARCGT